MKAAKQLRALQERVGAYVQRTRTEYSGHLYGGMEGVVALTSWRHDSLLIKSEQFNRYLRYCCATYLHLKGLGATPAPASAVRLFSLLAKSGRVLAALQVAVRCCGPLPRAGRSTARVPAPWSPLPLPRRATWLPAAC